MLSEANALCTCFRLFSSSLCIGEGWALPLKTNDRADTHEVLNQGCQIASHLGHLHEKSIPQINTSLAAQIEPAEAVFLAHVIIGVSQTKEKETATKGNVTSKGTDQEGWEKETMLKRGESPTIKCVALLSMLLLLRFHLIKHLSCELSRNNAA